MTPDHLSSLDAELQQLAAAIEIPDPAFEFEIGWSTSYDAFFKGVREARTGLNGLLERARAHGRVMLHAEGGGGKTSVLNRLFVESIRSGDIAVFVDLKRWRPPMFARWDRLRGNESLRMEVLLLEIGAPRLAPTTIAALSPERTTYVLVDGLNEVPLNIGQDILDCVEAFARRHPQAGVIVTDRLRRRDLPTDRWQLATVEKLSAAQIADVVGSLSTSLDNYLLGSPFFLDMVSRQGLESASGFQVFSGYFTERVNLNGEDLERAARASFEVYAIQQSRSFDPLHFASTSGAAVLGRLIESGTVVRTDDLAYFAHHLFHDFLAARWMARDPGTWHRKYFDAITFRTASFDALALALQMIQEQSGADHFLREVYDWNFYGAAYALAKGRQLGSTCVSHDMEVILLATLAERRWDPVPATVERVTDALRLFPSALARQLVEARDHAAAIDLVLETPLEGQASERWRELFGLPRSSPVEDATIEMIREPDPVIGWTASNVLKRAAVDDRQAERLREIFLASDDPTIRWRVAHTLGAFPSPATVDALIAALDDPDRWVRYGAIRSLVECAWREDVLRKSILETIAGRAAVLANDEATLKELERALLITDPPSDWADALQPLVEALWLTARTIETQDDWRRLAHRIDEAMRERSDA